MFFFYCTAVEFLHITLCKALGSRIEVHGSMEFIDNDGSGVGGGALYLESTSFLKLFQGANLTFVGNTGV